MNFAQNDNTIKLIDSFFPGPSKDVNELYKRIFKSKDQQLVKLFK